MNRVVGLRLAELYAQQLQLGADVQADPADERGETHNRHTSTAQVLLRDERIAGVHAMAGAVAHISILRIAMEYDAASVQTRTMRIGVAF